MVDILMSKSPLNLSDDPAVLKAIIASLEVENAKLSATLGRRAERNGEVS